MVRQRPNHTYVRKQHLVCKLSNKPAVGLPRNPGKLVPQDTADSGAQADLKADGHRVLLRGGMRVCSETQA